MLGWELKLRVLQVTSIIHFIHSNHLKKTGIDKNKVIACFFRVCLLPHFQTLALYGETTEIFQVGYFTWTLANTCSHQSCFHHKKVCHGFFQLMAQEIKWIVLMFILAFLSSLVSTKRKYRNSPRFLEVIPLIGNHCELWLSLGNTVFIIAG